jgi:hypothetical protein
VISNRRGPQSCLGRVFNSKFGRFATLLGMVISFIQPLLELKTSVSSNLSKLYPFPIFLVKARSLHRDRVRRLHLNRLRCFENTLDYYLYAKIVQNNFGTLNIVACTTKFYRCKFKSRVVRWCFGHSQPLH